MPYTQISQVPDRIPSNKKKQWMDIWNAAYKKAKAEGKSEKEAESTAFAQANGVIKKESKSMSSKREFRYSVTSELRASTDKSKLTGYAATFNSESEDLGGFRETVSPGAFQRALSEQQDVRLLFNHDPSLILARTKAGTLRLMEDERGLKFEADMPETQLARDLMASVSRGDVSEMSFGFRAVSQEWTEPDEGETCSHRKLTDVDLFDVSPVTYPAYKSTSVSLRDLWPDGLPEEIEARAATMKKEADGEHPASHYLVVEDDSKPSTWHLRVRDVDGKPDHHLMGAAWAALHGGYRGNKYEGPGKQEAITKLEKLYKSEDMELPSEEKSLCPRCEEKDMQIRALRIALDAARDLAH